MDTRTIKIFVSSVSKQLESTRKQIIQDLSKAGYDVRAMEKFGAQPSHFDRRVFGRAPGTTFRQPHGEGLAAADLFPVERQKARRLDKMGPDLGSTDDSVRDTYAHFGVAIFRAQTLETEIVNAMVIARLPERAHITRQEIDVFMNRPLTLGRLLKELKKYIQVHDELKQTLWKAHEKRNWLVHHFFKERAQGIHILSWLQSDDQ